ncbi:MAG TPA: prepilin-type N-terminal cleavage/methylation domain-containing protein [Terriglobia bacterium]
MRRSANRGITLIEMLVVMVLIAMIGSIVGPAVVRRFDTITLQTTATELASQLRRAQAVARADQSPVEMTYSDHVFQFWKSSKPVASYTLPAAVTPVNHNLPAFVFLPSGQILGAEALELQNERGRRIAIKTDLLSGITVSFGAAL